MTSLTLPESDTYLRSLAEHFHELDRHDPLKKPKPPHDVKNKSHLSSQLREARGKAYADAVRRWESDYKEPWKQRNLARLNAERAERDAHRRRPSGASYV